MLLKQSIFSNKVLHSIPRDLLKTSFDNQARTLNKNGLFCHTFWYGDKILQVEDMTFFYYTEHTIQKHLPANIEIVHHEVYKEMDDDDSMLIIARKK